LTLNIKMNIQTGFGDAGDNMMKQYIDTMINIVQPVIEKSTLLAAEYCKACGRDVILSEDMEYAMKYCAINTVGKTIGSIMPEIYDEGGSDEDSGTSTDEDSDVPIEDCPPFERYSGNDPTFLQINNAYDQWDEWVPQNPTEELLKNAINSNEHIG
tara:strand:+ start:4801 stop:5268 length:468 start_codon:yes stop_codon:yes gene_type:complete